MIYKNWEIELTYSIIDDYDHVYSWDYSIKWRLKWVYDKNFNFGEIPFKSQIKVCLLMKLG